MGREDIIVMGICFCILVGAVLIFLWRDRGYYKTTTDQYSLIMSQHAALVKRQNDIDLQTKELLKTIAEQKVKYTELKEKTEAQLKHATEEIDELYLAFQNVYKDHEGSKRLIHELKHPAKKEVNFNVPPIQFEVIHKNAPKEKKLPAPTNPRAKTKTSRVRSTIDEAKRNSKGL